MVWRSRYRAFPAPISRPDDLWKGFVMPLQIVEDFKSKFTQPIANANMIALGALALAAIALLIALNHGGK
jgi:hypothetical protein